MSNENVSNTESKELGISLDKKTVIAIISALVLIMALVGVLTQVLQRGEYDVIVEGKLVKTVFRKLKLACRDKIYRVFVA